MAHDDEGAALKSELDLWGVRDFHQIGNNLPPLPECGEPRTRIDATPTPLHSASAAEESDTLKALRLWLRSYEGNQRRMLEDLRGKWSERLRGENPQLLGKVLRKSVRSPKLRAARDRFLAELAES